MTTITIAVADQAMLDRLSTTETETELVVWTTGDAPLGRPIDLLVLPYTVSPNALPKLLPLADIVVIAVPLAAATTNLVSGDFLDLLAPGALLVNVSRGAIVDTHALTERARTGAIRVALTSSSRSHGLLITHCGPFPACSSHRTSLATSRACRRGSIPPCANRSPSCSPAVHP